MQDLHDRVVVITGGASGIGRAMADRFASDGARIVLSDVQPDALKQSVSALAANGADVLGVPTDVSSADDVEDLAEAAYRRFGAVHVVCANAGVMQSLGPVWERPREDFEWVFGVNLWGPLHCVKSFLPRMLDAGEAGHVVITASMSGVTVVPGNAAYQMAKHGAVALAETLYHELADSQIDVSVLCPGFVETGILTSARNRPDALRPDVAPPERPMAGGWSGGATEALKAIAVPPETVADQVAQAIRDSQFWILTHENGRDRVRSRLAPILEGRNPVLDPSAPSSKD